MKIRRILGEHGPLAEPCSGGSCPTVILTDGDAAFVQGYQPTPEERQSLKSPDGEDFVRIPLPILRKLAVQLAES